MNETAKQYTAFWPVFLVFLCFTITNILNLIGNLETKSHLATALNQLAQSYNKAQAKEAALRGIAHDLIGLAPTSAVAQQIVTDFKIQEKGAPAGTGSAATAPAPTNAATSNNAPSHP
jgi:hypothetical protein